MKQYITELKCDSVHRSKSHFLSVQQRLNTRCALLKAAFVLLRPRRDGHNIAPAGHAEAAIERDGARRRRRQDELPEAAHKWCGVYVHVSGIYVLVEHYWQGWSCLSAMGRVGAGGRINCHKQHMNVVCMCTWCIRATSYFEVQYGCI
jgi:hypothetical protein